MVALANPPTEFEFVPSGVLIPDLSGVQRGPEGFRRILEVFLAEFDALRVEVHDLIDAGDQVFTSFIHGRGQHSGAETSLDGWVVWTVQEGRVTRNSDSRTRGPALEAAGLSQ